MALKLFWSDGSTPSNSLTFDSPLLSCLAYIYHCTRTLHLVLLGLEPRLASGVWISKLTEIFWVSFEPVSNWSCTLVSLERDKLKVTGSSLVSFHSVFLIPLIIESQPVKIFDEKNFFVAFQNFFVFNLINRFLIPRKFSADFSRLGEKPSKQRRWRLRWKAWKIESRKLD